MREQGQLLEPVVVRVTVAGSPVAQPRLRHDVRLHRVGRCGACGASGLNRMGKWCKKCAGLGILIRRTPVSGTPMVIRDGKRAQHPIHEYRRRVAAAARAAYQGQPHAGPVGLSLTFILPRPKAITWKTKSMPRRPHVATPDRSNLEKGVEDALTGILWVDDSQVCQGPIEKWVAAGGEAPHTVIEATLFPTDF